MSRPDAQPACRARLFMADASVREVACEDLAKVRPDEDAMLWVDLLNPDDAMMRDAWSACELPDEAREGLGDGSLPKLERYGDIFVVHAVAIVDDDLDGARGTPLVLVAGSNIVVTVHGHAIAFIDDLMEREAGASYIGRLGADSFVAALLDWQLSTYFDAVATFENGVDRLEQDILGEDSKECLPELRRLRKSAARLRRLLAPHRAVFAALSRPDFRHDEDADADRHFVALDTRFERAMDMVENARELVVGSFELFTSQTALRTDRTMRVLTVVTVITGLLATIAGILGMNFQAAFFDSADAGFMAAVGAMLLVGGGAMLLARRRGWA